MPRTGVLVVVVVRDGRWSASSCIESAAATCGGVHDVDVLVIDDRHPDEVRTSELLERCEGLAVMHYRSPRRLGAPRAMNLGLERAIAEGYDHVLLVRRSVILPQRIAETMIKVAEANAGVGSVAAWSNGGSPPSIANGKGGDALRRHGMVDWIAGDLADEFGSAALDIPASSGSCLLIPVPALVKVGQIDPVYAAADFETVDWCLRSRERGYRAVFAPASFVVEADDGPAVEGGDVEVAEEEQIIDMRYPWRRADQCAFDASGSLEMWSDRAVRAIIVGAAGRWGYEVEATWVPTAPDAERVRFVVDPDGRSGTAGAEYCGIRTDLEVPAADLPAMLQDLTGAAPAQVFLSDRGLFADQLTAAWAGKVPFIDRRRYPQRV